MAKFKVGDRVKVKGGGVETILAVYPKGRGAVGMRLDPSVDWYGSSEGGFITDEDIDGIANSAVRSTNAVVQNALNACGTARNAMGIAEAEQRAGQFVAAAKSRIAAEAGTLRDSIKLLKQVRGHEGSKRIQDALVVLQWALSDVEEAIAKF